MHGQAALVEGEHALIAFRGLVDEEALVTTKIGLGEGYH